MDIVPARKGRLFVFIKPLGYRAALLVKTNFILIENKL
ncbi:hypothetical protein EUS_27460 [[Eubacterium] siraeum 70/3]|uniref:Uncharacterized protein n=1 Tax=[Eubacterium] siraeum 70/3 TaxID=657319 RepID=D4JX46_9FIRM|nr:hypothetical protein EUS_27460 [[Eubacterium] siraeum 70/3]